ncbi:response regulator [Candidatus Magnetobacterium bavaricum]|uniref:Response regulator n=1 Tax=Candidatus Magnetobacterium bavaricum TaxID=29290 RepID=A0A0F3GQR3_9BACT|nr:response regulator [Candidatus Magnetobacterium bavaricum]
MVKKVLIADNDEVTNRLISSQLEKQGYEVYTASTGRNAINKALLHIPDILILDLDLPTRGGAETLREIRSYKDLKGILTLVVTVRASKEDVINAIKIGAHDYILKPLKIGTLLGKLASWANTEMEAHWKKLKPEQENTLRLMKVTMERAVDAIKQRAPLPYEDMVSAIDVLDFAIKRDGVGDIVGAVDGYNTTMFLHSLLVAVYMHWFGGLRGVSEKERRQMALGGLMHDLGSVLIPSALLFKPDKLDPHEYKDIKSHVGYTMDILGALGEVSDIVRNICWEHHEKIDGSGYPRALKADAISIHGRMMAIVEAYAALTTKNVYRPIYAPTEALKMLHTPVGHLDPELIEEFSRAMLSEFNLE